MTEYYTSFTKKESIMMLVYTFFAVLGSAVLGIVLGLLFPCLRDIFTWN